VSDVLAPAAPGGLAERPTPAAVLAYLGKLDAWVDGRRAELDDIDEAALVSPRRDEVSGDVVLSMALWKSVSDRRDQIEAEFAGGRVDAGDLDRIAVLIWGRLDSAAATAAGAMVSVPEACRLSDALAAALRARLGLAPAVEESARRLRSLRAQLDRLHDQVALEPPASRPTAQRQLDALSVRVADVAVRLERGGDIGGLLGPLENDASRTERDLIVGGVQRREARDQFAALERLRADLTTREAHVTALADEAVATVVPVPRNAVPDVSLLGAAPIDPGALAAYGQRLARVGQAMDIAEERYAAALAARSALVDRLAAARVKAEATGVSTSPDVAAAAALAQDLLDRRPTPVAVLEHLVGAYLAWIDLAGQSAPATRAGRTAS